MTLVSRALIAFACALAAGAAAAQAPRSALPDRRLDPPPLPAPIADGAVALTPVDGPAPEAPRGVALSMRLNAVAFRGVNPDGDGARLLEAPGFREAVDAARGEIVDFPRIEGLRRSLNEALVSGGFISSSVRLAEIDLDQGLDIFDVAVGRLTALNVVGEGVAAGADARDLGDLSADYIRARLATDSEVFSLPETEEALRVLIRDRNVERVTAAVRPGAAPGETVLEVETAARRPYDLAATIANDTPDGIGEETLTLSGAARNIATSGDQLAFEARLSEGRRAIALEADAPLWPGGPAPFLAFEHARAEFVVGDFAALDVESRFTRFGFGLRLPLLETSSRRLTSVLAFDLKRTRSTLLDEPFSFSAGVQNGRTRLSVLSLAQEFVDIAEDRTLALRAEANLGLPILSATRNPGDAPDGEFFTLVGQMQVAQRLAPEVTLIGRVQGQYASRALLPIEQVAIGGRETVRGFGESALTGDEALTGSLEARIALFDAPAP
ncbi:MAG: ShlB/FhaC/HecB family hemolysin secretion/activation protein, partial [Pseudomonadota bacterium]